MLATRRFATAFMILSAIGLGCGKKPAPVAEADPDGEEVRPRPRPKRVVDADAPFPGADPVPAPKKKAAPAWGGGGAAVPLKHDSRVTFGPPGCPVFIVDQDVYDLKTFKVIRQLPDGYERYARRALSRDGRYFAVTKKGWNEEDTETYVYATDTGEKALTIPPAAKGAYVDNLAFFAGSHLFLGGRHGPGIQVWGIADGKMAGELTCPEKQVRETTVAYTPDGATYATINRDKVVVAATSTNRTVAVMATPGDGPGERPNGIHGGTFIYAWAKGMAFSPDGSELALFSTHSVPRLLVWNTKGQLVVDSPVPMPQFVGHDTTLEWLPDGSGWLVNGYLFDRATKRVLLSVRVPFASSVLPHLADQNRLIGRLGGEENALQAAPIPWGKLQAALKAAEDKADAYLAPGQPVALDLQLNGLRGDANETRTLLGQALTKRLARDGIPVAAQAPTVVRMKLSEQAGDALPIRERQSPFDFQGRDTGRKATEAKGSVVLELWAQGESAPLWRGSLTAGSSRSFSEEINDATVRKSMLENLGRQLDSLEVPYFMPRDKDTLALPAVID
ncbi:MAG TPA: WD40 repeat domain-containing protein [Urbifossiella sp.]|jgi:hypothetical protein|nr:WD40 repeat domain-containing protein [Urbifossiella sp.]